MTERDRTSPVSGWQPIETAPRDKTDIWLGKRRYKPIVGFWFPRSKEWLDTHYGDPLPFDPTHWQHLPEPPQ